MVSLLYVLSMSEHEPAAEIVTDKFGPGGQICGVVGNDDIPKDVSKLTYFQIIKLLIKPEEMNPVCISCLCDIAGRERKYSMATFKAELYSSGLLMYLCSISHR